MHVRAQSVLTSCTILGKATVLHVISCCTLRCAPVYSYPCVTSDALACMCAFCLRHDHASLNSVPVCLGLSYPARPSILNSQWTLSPSHAARQGILH